MKVFKDGDHFCITKDDFENLQISPAVFFHEESENGKILAENLDVFDLSFGELVRIERKLSSMK